MPGGNVVRVAQPRQRIAGANREPSPRAARVIAALTTAGALALTFGSPDASAESFPPDGPTASAARANAPSAKVTVPPAVTQGDRFTVHVTVKHRAQVRRVHVQQRVANVYGDWSWLTVKKLRVRSGAGVDYQAVAGETDRETYRALLQPKSGKPVASRPASVEVWHWYPLSDFDSYYSTGGVVDATYGQFTMNGSAYIGSWYTYGTSRSWESRYTLGRRCRTMRGTFGVTDKSADGSSATIQVLAEGVDVVYASSPLAPGVVDTPLVPLATPYRISVIGTNTSPDGVAAYPAAGDLQFLCHGFE